MPPGHKDGGLHTQPKKVLQMFGFGIVEASFPLANGTAGDLKQGGQSCWRQAKAGAQLEHDLPNGIVALMIGVPRQGRAPCLPRDPGQPTSNAKQREERCHLLAADSTRPSRYTYVC
jgi:hypothetical protein